MTRQGYLKGVLLALCLQVLPWTAGAQPAYPTRPIRIITPFAAGQGPDVLLRNLAEKLGPALGQPVLVDNKPGASGFIAFQAARAAAPDGYTLVHMDSFHLGTQPHLFSKLPYNARRDFEPVSPLVRNSFFVVVSSQSKWKSLSDLLAAARARPEQVRYGSWGVGSPAHLGALMLESAAGVRMSHVPYKEASQLYAGVATGETDWAIGSAVSVAPLLQAGRLRLLAAAAPQRIAGYDSVPTAAESGGPSSWVVGGWNGLLAPKGTPKAVLQRLQTEIATAMQSTEMRDKLAVFTYEPYTMSSADMVRLIEQEQAAWGAVLQTSGIRLD